MKSEQTQRSVFICPQHWGLGHITRTIPIIEYFVQHNYRVILGCSGAGSILLKKEFPELPLYELPDYGISYPSSNMYWNMGIQMIKMHKAILQEKWSIKKICADEKIDLIISDSRFGGAQKGTPSIVIAHHLFLPLGSRIFEWISGAWMRFFYIQFDQIWIPDYKEEPNLSGRLSHPFHSDKHFYIGPLSRLQRKEGSEHLFDVAFVLSGPEPQRTYFEQKILSQIHLINDKKLILVRGVETSSEDLKKFPIPTEGLVNRFRLNEILNQSSILVCRSGYTSILDLSVLRKKALMIPTPGQPEQEYLAKELERKKIFHCVDQRDLELPKDIKLTENYFGFLHFPENPQLKEILDTLIEKAFVEKRKI